MAEVQEIRDVREIPVRTPISAPAKRAGLGAFLLTFFFGILCAVAIAGAALWVLGVDTTISWPSGHIQLGHHAGAVVIVDHSK